MSKLTAAIRDLKRCLNPKTGQTYSDAIRVLEAAEKMNKKGVIEVMDRANEFFGFDGDDDYESIRALIESLPDPEKEPGK